MEDLRHRRLVRVADGRIRHEASRPDLYHVVKKGSSSRTRRLEPVRNRAILCANPVALLRSDRCHAGSGRTVLAQPVYNRARYRNLMSDRKYRQRGYQDDDRDRPADAQDRRGPRPSPAPLPAPAESRRTARETSTCRATARSSGARSAAPSSRARSGSTAAACAAAPTCTPARSARPSIPAAASSACSRFRRGSRPRTRRNSCTLYSARTTVERETTAPRTDDARKAFDDLFKF